MHNVDGALSTKYMTSEEKSLPFPALLLVGEVRATDLVKLALFPMPISLQMVNTDTGRATIAGGFF